MTDWHDANLLGTDVARDVSPRAEDTAWWVLHVDLDQFLAAVEVARRPELRGRPVVVGGNGDPTEARKVVATASYEARAFGVRSGMPLRTAARRCPEAVFLPADAPAYNAASAEVMAALRTLPVVVEEVGWDEAFLGASTEDPWALAAVARRAVLASTGLSCSVGIGENKVQAKLATGFAKPDGVAALTGATWDTVMGDRPVEALWGVGRRSALRLAAIGVRSVRDLANAERAVLATAFGPTIGPYLGALGRGLGSTRITAEPRVPRGRSRETTYPVDLVARSEVTAEVDRLAREMAGEAAAIGRLVVRIAVKVRFAPYLTQTRMRTLPEATTEPNAVAAGALVALERFTLGRPVRLLGVRVELDDPAS